MIIIPIHSVQWLSAHKVKALCWGLEMRQEEDTVLSSGRVKFRE